MILQREAIFIDGSYLDIIVKAAIGEKRLNYAKFVKAIRTNKYEHLRTYYYHCRPLSKSQGGGSEEIRKKMDKFFASLEKLDKFEVKFGKLQKFGGKLKQKGVDVQLSVDLVRLSCGRHIQKAILIAGDQDFKPAVQAAKDAGVLVKLAYSPQSISDELLKTCDESKKLEQSFLEKNCLDKNEINRVSDSSK